jgi:hypothetical protein
VKNEEAEHPVVDLSRMMIIMSNQPNEVCKEMLMEELKKVLIEYS